AEAALRPTPRLVGAVALAAVVEWYGTTSEVSWLFLLASWIAALCLASVVYAFWNRAGLRAYLGVGGATSTPGSPIDDLPVQLLRTAPLQAPIFEGDGLESEVGLDARGAPRGPARLFGLIGSEPVNIATGLVARSGWRRTIHLE